MRSHVYTEEVQTAIGEVYPFSFAANMSIEKMDLSDERFKVEGIYFVGVGQGGCGRGGSGQDGEEVCAKGKGKKD